VTEAVLKCPICQHDHTEDGTDLTVARDEYLGGRVGDEALRAALEGMVYQFGYQTEGPAVYTGGLSALEEAFSVLGWDDPHPVSDWAGCEVEGCREWNSSGQRWGDLYLHLCFRHSEALRNGEPRPPIKQHALDREATRGPDGVLRRA
jgi:hypothetical protein